MPTFWAHSFRARTCTSVYILFGTSFWANCFYAKKIPKMQLLSTEWSADMRLVRLGSPRKHCVVCTFSLLPWLLGLKCLMHPANVISVMYRKQSDWQHSGGSWLTSASVHEWKPVVVLKQIKVNSYVFCFPPRFQKILWFLKPLELCMKDEAHLAIYLHYALIHFKGLIFSWIQFFRCR